MNDLIGSAHFVNGALEIQHVITADDPFGEPWPPDGSCSVVRRARGFTLWRRISQRTRTLPHVRMRPFYSGDQR